MSKVSGIIFFDLDDTLFLTSKFAKLARDRAFKKVVSINSDLNYEDLLVEFQKVYEEYGSNYSFHFDEIFKRLGITDKKKLSEYVAICVMEYHKYKLKMNNFLPPNIYNVLNTLKKKNYILGIITIGLGKKQWDKIYRLGLDNFFDSENVYISEVNNFKKDFSFFKKIYDIYTKTYDTKNIWMIGDREDGDILPSKKAGFKTIRLKQGKRIYNFDKSKADFKVENFKEIKKIILSSHKKNFFEKWL
jgi:putative hydrolase of the HAD superfamily